MKAVPDMIGRFVTAPYVPLGTDGMGRSDTREALRRHFEIDAEHVAFAALSALVKAKKFDAKKAAKAAVDLGIDAERAEPRDA